MNRDEIKPKMIFHKYIHNSTGYIEKYNYIKHFYSLIYLIYLAKINNIQLQKPYSIYRGSDEGIGFRALLAKLLKIYEDRKKMSNDYPILKEIEELYEESDISQELDQKLFDNILESTEKMEEKDFLEIFKENSMEFSMFPNKEQNSTNESLIILVNSLLQISEFDDILDLCSGKGDFLAHLAYYLKKAQFTGVEIDNDVAFISKVRLTALAKNSEIIVDDALKHNFDRRFDKIFCEYPLGLRTSNLKIEQQSKKLFFNWDKVGLTADWKFIDKILASLKGSGMAALIIADAPLYKAMDADCRKDLIASGAVKYIIKLPKGLLQNAKISTNLVILSRDNRKKEIKFIDASEEYTENKHKEKQLQVGTIMNLIGSRDSKKVITIKNSDILATEEAVLTVNTYLKKDEPIYFNPHELKEFISETNDRYRGYQLTQKEQAEIENPNGDYNLLTVGDVNDGLISDNLTAIDSNNNKYDRYLLKDGDIVITSKGSKLKIGVVETKNRKIIPNGNLLILRVNKAEINPYYLEAFLNSENGRLAIKQIQTGAVTISINPSRIEKLKISMIDKETQDKFVEEYMKKKIELIKKQKEVEKLKKEVDDLFKNKIEKNQLNRR